MDRKQLEYKVIALDKAVDESPGDAQLYLLRGRAHYKLGQLDSALNDFVRVRELDPGNLEAGEYVAMISEIFDFQYKETYNV